eukprot:832401_1
MAEDSGYRGADVEKVSKGKCSSSGSSNYIAYTGVSYCGFCSCGEYVSCEMGKDKTFRPSEEEETSAVVSPCCNHKFVIAEILLKKTTCTVNWKFNEAWAIKQNPKRSIYAQKKTYSPSGDDYVRLGGRDTYGQALLAVYHTVVFVHVVNMYHVKWVKIKHLDQQKKKKHQLLL